MKRKKKSWLAKFWKNHWDEMILIVSVVSGILMLMWGLGVFG